MRALILGTTGVDKARVWAALDQERHRVQAQTPRLIDFEHDYLIANGSMYSFLESEEAVQHLLWTGAWDRFLQALGDSSADFALAMHGAYLRSNFGTRTFLDPHRLVSLGLTHVITLIDDVWAAWDRTERRALEADAGWYGTPTLLQLVQGRGAEILIGDLIARELGLTNFVLSVAHPARVLNRYLFSGHRPWTVYLSFPISGPRKRLPDVSGVDELSSLLRRAGDLERGRPDVICLCPLAVDELPLLDFDPQQVYKQDVEGEDEPVRYVDFDPGARRWDVRSFWPDDVLLSPPPTSIVTVPVGQIEAADGGIRDDVAVRDYRLLAQSRALAVFNPQYDGARPRGVRDEIEQAQTTARPVLIYQDPKYDPEGTVRAEYQTRGSMGESRRRRFSRVSSDAGEMLESALHVRN